MNVFFKRVFYCLLVVHIYIQAQPFIDQKTALDLQLENLIPLIDRTKTGAGKKYLVDCIQNPLRCDRLEELITRQSYLKLFIETDGLRQALENDISLLGFYETALIEKAQRDGWKEKFLATIIFNGQTTTPFELNVRYLLNLSGYCLPLAEYLTLHTGIGFIFKSLLSAHDGCGHPQLQDGVIYYYLGQAIILGCHIPSLMNMAETIKERFAINHELQQELMAASDYLYHAQKVYALLKRQGVSPDNFEPLRILDGFFGEKPECSHDFLDLIATLETDTFTQKLPLFHDVGKILSTYAYYKNRKKEFEQIMHAIGIIDYYLGLADLFCTQTAEKPWSFAHYIDATTPMVKADKLYHLFLAKSSVRSWHIAHTEDIHTLITGENGSGKSTYVNGLGQALVLAQSIGIVPAEYFEYTPLGMLATYRLIQDNIFEGMSRFYAECARIETILDRTEQEIDFCCVLLDEPFTSTHTIKGSTYLKNALRRLFSVRHVMSFTITHYQNMTNFIENFSQANHLNFDSGSL